MNEIVLKHIGTNIARACPDIYFVYVPGGRYRDLGNHTGRYAADLRGFWISIFPISIAAYAAYIAEGRYVPSTETDTADSALQRLERSRRAGWSFALGLDHREATAFAENQGMRLPSETEWQVAMLDQPNVDAAPPDSQFAQLAQVRGALEGATPTSMTPEGELSFSQAGCAVLYERLTEWTADPFLDYARWGGLRHDLPPDRLQWNQPAVVKGRRAQAIEQTPRNRGSLEQARRQDPSIAPLGFRCVIRDR